MQCPPPRPRPSSDPRTVITSIPAFRSNVFVCVFRSYPTTTPGASATTLLPSSHCSRWASQTLPPVSTTRRVFSPEYFLDHVEEVPFVEMDLHPAFAVGACPVAANLIGHFAVRRAQIAVAEGEHRVEMHRRAALRHQAADDLSGAAMFEQLRCDLEHGLARGALAHADQHGAVADRHDVAAFDRRGAVRRRRCRPTRS